MALQKLTPPSTLGVATYAVVTGCGPRSLVPRGAWVMTTPYLTNDLATSLGSSWIAKRDNLGRLPITNPTYWEKFASKGDPGAAGLPGATGPQGSRGASGSQGLQGIQGPQGPEGPQGPAGAAGQSGASGIVQTVRLSGVPGPLPPSPNSRFIGPVAQVTVTAGQRFTGFVTVPVSSSGTALLIVNLCYKLGETGDLQPFGDHAGDMVIQVTTPTMLAVASTIAPGQPGTYQVGLCAINEFGATASFDVLSGWIQVTN